MSNDPFTQFSLSLPNFPDAKCASSDFDPDTWFPEALRDTDAKDSQIMVAQSHCFSCVHQVDCLQFALDNRIGDGIWGGSLPEERRAALGNQSKSAVRQGKLDAVRALVARGMSLERACADVGLSTKTFDRYRHFERAGWPPQVSNQRPNRTKAKENK
ncbi:MAG: WhiB family transcriptional regulator [Betaproteobacteria bacterium]|nr:WhiB family transcriptional regulator [Betaproteobacteria bacterium]